MPKPRKCRNLATLREQQPSGQNARGTHRVADHGAPVRRGAVRTYSDTATPLRKRRSLLFVLPVERLTHDFQCGLQLLDAVCRRAQQTLGL